MQGTWEYETKRIGDELQSDKRGIVNLHSRVTPIVQLLGHWLLFIHTAIHGNEQLGTNNSLIKETN